MTEVPSPENSRSDPPSLWRTARSHFGLEPDERGAPPLINLNSGTASPVPKPVRDRLQSLTARQHQQPSVFFHFETPALMQTARAELATFLHGQPGSLLLLTNATVGLNIVLRSLCPTLAAGKTLLVGDHEYGAVKILCQQVAQQSSLGVREVILPFATEDPEEIVQAYAAAIDDTTAAVLFSHVTSPTGLVLPAESLCRLARERGILSIVDGAHAAGMLPVNLSAIDADYYAGNGHKWLQGPLGCGFLAVRPEHRLGLRPLVTSWGWEFDQTMPHADSGWGGSYWARSFEYYGTHDRTPLLVFPEVVEYQRAVAQLGDGAARVRFLRQRLSEAMGEHGLCPVTPHNPSLSGTMTAFALPPVDPLFCRRWMHQNAGIEVPVTSAAGRHFLRVSTPWYVQPEEIDALARVMPSFLNAISG